MCRTRGKPVQIHHIDDDPRNHVFQNLAVLCFDCHTDTQVTGGFHRKLDADQVILYRDDWHIMVARERSDARRRTHDQSEGKPTGFDVEYATTIAEVLRDTRQFASLAMHYDVLGNEELRDKYIEEYLAGKGQDGPPDDDSIIYFRSRQGRIDLVPRDLIDRDLRRRKRRKDWLGLGRLYRRLDEWQLAAQYTCRGVAERAQDNPFSAAFYLKEMYEEAAVEHLFKLALESAHAEGDLWWQCRSLQELGWASELSQLVLDNADYIEKSRDPLLHPLLASARGDAKEYLRLVKEQEQKQQLPPPKAPRRS